MLGVHLLGPGAALGVTRARATAGADRAGRSAGRSAWTPVRARRGRSRWAMSSCSSGYSELQLVDVALGGSVVASGALSRHEHDPLELGDENAVLVVGARVDLDGAAVGLGTGLLLFEHLGLDEQRVAVKNGRRVGEPLGGEVRDRLAADVRDGHA